MPSINRYARNLALIALAMITVISKAQNVSFKWEMSDPDNLASCSIEGDDAYTALISSTGQEIGQNLTVSGTMTNSNADAGYTAVTYNPAFTRFTPAKTVSGKTSGHYLSFTVTPQTNHTFKPKKISFDAAKVGTDKGNFDLYIKVGSNSETAVATAVALLRNKVTSGNENACGSYEYVISDYIADGQDFKIIIYPYNITGAESENPKNIAIRNVVVTGAVDEGIFTMSDFITQASCSAGDLYDLLQNLKNGEQAKFPYKLFSDPSDFVINCKEGYEATVEYNDKVARITIYKDNEEIMYADVRFVVSNRTPHETATPLNRGLVAVPASGGMLVSWRWRVDDDPNTRFNLLRDGTLINTNAPITATTNYLDSKGSRTSTYTLEVYDKDGNLIEKQENVKAWNSTCIQIATSTPEDERGLGATYTPNDCSACDMDGDGEPEIIVKWDPSNSKDPASNGTTSSTYFDCYKLDGTKLWRINLGMNIRSGAHTTPFLCYDFDGDGYGELIVKTAPGTIDGEGNYVVMGDDDPETSYVNSSGRILSGPEYLTVFDGLTGGEITSVAYHTNYQAGASVWGDSKGNRSDRYLAAMAFLDGEHPSAVFARGYYAGAFVGAYDFDGDELSLRWISKNTTSGKGLWGEGAHCMITADLDNDGKSEIVYGAAALDHDGSLLHRTGMGHGDAVHVGDFDPDNDGLEIFMVHEKSPYGYSLRDGKTGDILVRGTADGDTGRGLIADFDDDNPGAELAASCSYSLFNCKGDAIGNWNSGSSSSSSLNFKIYWDGDLYDEYNDRLHIDKWSSSSASFGRVNTLYNTYSTYSISTINGSKQNPNLQADILGDWREELIYYSTTDNSLILITTDQQSDYKMPYLRDDKQYDEAIVWQNVAYNQPPHVGFDPIKKFTMTRKMTKYGEEDSQAGWIAFYTTYPVQIPENCVVYRVTGRNNDCDTLRYKAYTSGVIPANTGVLIKSNEDSLSFVPSIKESTMSGASYLYGACVDSLLTTDETSGIYYYVFRDGEHGLGYYRTDGEMNPANQAWMRIKATASNPAHDYYLIGQSLNPTEIQSVTSDEQDKVIYDLRGIKIEKISVPGYYIINGKKKFINPIY